MERWGAELAGKRTATYTVTVNKRSDNWNRGAKHARSYSAFFVEAIGQPDGENFNVLHVEHEPSRFWRRQPLHDAFVHPNILPNPRPVPWLKHRVKGLRSYRTGEDPTGCHPTQRWRQ